MEYLASFVTVTAVVIVWCGLSLDKGCPECGSTAYLKVVENKNLAGGDDVKCIACDKMFTEDNCLR